MNLPPTADLLLALRYLRPKRTFVSFLTLLSVLGPVLGVALLVIVSAIMSGFNRDIRARILDMQAHLQVYPPLSLQPDRPAAIHDPAPILAAIEKLGGHGSPVIDGPVLLQVRDRITPKFLKGIRPELDRQVTRLENPDFAGRYEIQPGEALVGRELAQELGLKLGSKLLIHAPAKLTQNIQWRPDGQVEIRPSDTVYLPEEVTVAGIFSQGVYDFDSAIVLIHLDQAADLFGLPLDSATSIQVKVPDPFAMDGFLQALADQFLDYRLLSWQEANRQLFGALKVEKNLMFFLLFFIVIVAAFGIAGTLITVVVQKTKEIGILKAVGMGRLAIARIFLLQGAAIGVLGTGLGIGAGLLVVRFRNPIAWLLGKVMGVEVFPKELYHLSQIPAYLTPADLGVITVVSLLLCIAGAVVPALFAAALSPAQALREEN
ncbi:MAG: ABC transporter permease [Lentisphaeria bacterium]|jgi:lipoprotein-releasing system permease protein